VNWYVIYTKRGQEERALANLERQGIGCYLPMLRTQKILRGAAETVLEPLFPRYLFIRLDPGGAGWGALRSTRGVTRPVTFGSEPAVVDDGLIALLQSNEEAMNSAPLFEAGEQVRVTSGPFSGIEGIYLVADGESRAMVLVELLSKPTRLPVSVAQIRRLSN
jgi:transcriptional antiterminator RfaH